MIEFTFKGGRDGKVSAQLDGRCCYMEWEMLLGKVPCVIYRGSGCWIAEEKIPMTPTEEDIFLEELSKWALKENLNFKIA